MKYLLVLSVSIAFLGGCAANPRAEAGQASGRQANLITIGEIQQAPASQTAFDLIRGLRPNWLQGRGVQSLGSPTAGRPTSAMMHSAVVYLDGTRAGGPEILRQIFARDIREARYLSATEASSRFGTNHTGGAILITTRRG